VRWKAGGAGPEPHMQNRSACWAVWSGYSGGSLDLRDGYLQTCRDEKANLYLVDRSFPDLGTVFTPHFVMLPAVPVAAIPSYALVGFEGNNQRCFERLVLS
jgi:hypothetical protein